MTRFLTPEQRAENLKKQREQQNLRTVNELLSRPSKAPLPVKKTEELAKVLPFPGKKKNEEADTARSVL